MSNLIIKNLDRNEVLNEAAARAIFGGINEWIHIPLPSRSISPVSVVSFNVQTTHNTYNTYVDNDYTLIQPQVFNIGNQTQNTGSINYNISPQFVSAVSPINVQA